ncbi:hypothetical protein ACQPX6_13980 [Actinomycetospora sp. CA-101289]|uniref:hypothetical protein n=1 Tax=Actinomycetospora sp. CA-101289 TaxID=3239893 RepID=UPI003D96EB4A
MSSSDVLVVGLLALGGFLIGGVVSFWSRNRLVAGVLAALAVLALGGAILRLVS